MSPLPRFSRLLRCNSQLQLYRCLFLSALLFGGQGWLWLHPAIAQVVPELSPPPGTVIENQATGSYLDDADLTDKAIESDRVTLTVSEVAGITVTAGEITGSTVTGGLAYFDFILTNVGNDSTQFFIPDTATIAGGTQTGNIKIISYDSDGSGTAASVPLDVTVLAGGRKTGVLLSGVTTANNGIIPAGGTIKIRVPIQISATTGNVDVRVGDTPANGQNQAYIAGTQDVYTVDNINNSSGETDGPPLNGEREASLLQSLAVAITSNSTNAPTLTCSSDRRIFGTAYNGSGGFFTTGRDTYWDSAIGTASGPPPTSGWIDAYNIESVKPGVWLTTPYGDSAWISHYVNGDHNAVGRVDNYFRYQFNLSPTVDVNSFQLKMDFLGDNSIADIFINGVSQKNSYPTVLPQPIGGGDPYQFGGFFGTGKAALALTQNWQTGSNEIIVQVKSDPGFVGFVAESQPSYLCKSDAGDAPISYGTTPHAIITNPTVYLGSIAPDTDPFGGQPSPIANGDNNNGTNDEDAFTTALKAPISGNYNLSVPVHNTSGGSATLHAWIDFDQDGKFSSREYQSIAVANNAITANLSWAVPSGSTIGASYARFRLTTSALSDNSATLDVDERSTTSADNGEVEDYPIDLIGNPNLLLVKRITAINGLLAKQDGSSLAGYENDPANPYDDNQNATPVAPNTRPTTNKWPVNTTTNQIEFLQGAVNGGTIKPSDTVEYTIYFLSAGESAARNVQFCDRVPANVTFIPNSFSSVTADPLGLAGVDRGIAIRLGNALTAYTNINDNDIARYYPPLSEPSTDFPTINCGGANTNGAVVVNLGDRQNATAPGVPTSSYGFVRFRGQVK